MAFGQWHVGSVVPRVRLEGGRAMKCPNCEGARSSSGETFGPHEVWIPQGITVLSVLMELSNPCSISGFPREPMLIRVLCFNALCNDGFQIDFHNRHSVEEPCVIRWRRCTMRCDNGFLV